VVTKICISILQSLAMNGSCSATERPIATIRHSTEAVDVNMSRLVPIRRCRRRDQTVDRGPKERRWVASAASRQPGSEPWPFAVFEPSVTSVTSAAGSEETNWWAWAKV
jgi:hypothetical protein